MVASGLQVPRFYNSRKTHLENMTLYSTHYNELRSVFVYAKYVKS